MQQTVREAAMRFVLATLAGSLTLLVVGGVLYGVVFVDLFAEGALRLPGVMRSQPEFGWIVLGQLGFGTLVTLVMKWRGATNWKQGARTGVVCGFLMAVGYDFAQYGTSHLWTLRATLVDPLITALLVGSAGAAAGWVLGWRSGPSPWGT